ncbi:MAG: hypothetical protein R3C59_08325 [Planctomycetaceae bacterium]
MHVSPLSSRRQFLQRTLAFGSALTAGRAWGAADSLRMAAFRFDVTPPVGHPLAGGWIMPMVDCVDELEAVGLVITGCGRPIVLCVVDWVGIMNDAHAAWTSALAQAAGTTTDRVAVHCVHQHDAPFVCLHAQRIAEEFKTELNVMDVSFFEDCLTRAGRAVAEGLAKARPLTHVAHGEGRVEKVASNRRVAVGADGRLEVRRMRGSSCTTPDLIAMPEGLIDPILKTVAFYDGTEKIAACHYYATHPMSMYGKGHVSSDFPGLARKQRQKDEPRCAHLYFTGCGGNIAAGKYNDGSAEARDGLIQRVYEGIVASEKALIPRPVESVTWQSCEFLPEINPAFKMDELRSMVANSANAPVNRLRPAIRIAWMQRILDRKPMILSALNLNDATLLHLPGEPFVEFQLRLQQAYPERFIATAAYGDGGPWYIPTKEAWPVGGYEVTVAHVAQSADESLTNGVQQCLVS